MITKETYGRILVLISLLTLLILVICSFVVSFQIADLLYAICIIVFMIKYYGMKWFYDWYSLSYF